MRSPLIIGTRGSDLALWQARHIQELLIRIGLNSELRIIKTQGDQIQHLSFDKLEGKGFFTKEIEEALLAGETDIAVHSHKDLPTLSDDRLVIAAVTEREDPSELLLINKGKVEAGSKFQVAHGAVVGTSSNRRKSQLIAFRPDLKLTDLRGNVPTRISKLREGNYDAVLIAAAGVERLELDLSEFHVEKLDPVEFIPAPAQGALAVQVRKSDTELRNKLADLNDKSSSILTAIERKVLHLFKGGCQMPVGAYAGFDDESEMYHVRVSRAPDGDSLPVSVYAESKDPESLAQRVVEKILNVNPCRVFISREVPGNSFFRNVLEGNKFELEAMALIDIKAIPFSTVAETAWIFFSSKQAVKYFFRQKPKLGKQKFACVGKSTSEALRHYGVRADFIGSGTDTRMTGKQFAALVGNEKVLFPQAKGSLRSVQQQFVKPGQVVDLVVYESIRRHPEKMPDAQIIVFTSPSNVEAWFESFTIRKDHRVIAMGDATVNALRQHKVIMLSKTDSFDEAGLARAVFSASSR